KIAIVVIVNKCDGQRSALRADAGCLGYVLECPVALIMKQQNTICGCDGQIGVAIIVVVAGCACDCMHFGIEPWFFRYVFKFAATCIVKKRHSSLGSAISKKQIRTAVIIEIKKTRSGANLICSRGADQSRERQS